MFRKHAELDLERQADMICQLVDTCTEMLSSDKKQFLEKFIIDISKKNGPKITIIDKDNIVIADELVKKIGETYDTLLNHNINFGVLFQKTNDNTSAHLVNMYKGKNKNIWAFPIISKSKQYLGTLILRYNLSGYGTVYVLKHLFIFWLIMLIIFMTITSLYSVCFSYELVKPLELLKEGAMVVAEGNMSYKIPVESNDEFGLVTKSFNHMTTKLAGTYRRLSELLNYIKTILDTVGCMVFVVDSDGQIKSVNKKACDMLGYKDEEILGRPIDVIGREIGNNIKGLVGKISRSQTSREIIDHADFIAKDCKKIPCLVVTSCAIVEESVLVVISAQDLSPVISLQEKLAEERNRLLVTLRSIGDGVIVTDMEGKVVLMNIVAEKLTGWSEKEANGKFLTQIFRIINENTREPYNNPFEEVIKLGQIVKLPDHTILISQDGTEISIADSGAPIKDSSGRMIGVVLVFRDITQERLLHKELFKRQKLKSIGVLAGGIAHDFNNILSGILGNIEIASMKIEFDEKIRRNLDLAKKAALRATHLTQQLLTFAKGGEPIKTVASIKDIIVDSANFILSGTKIRCNYIFPEHLWVTKVDKGQISQVIQNLVINARHAMLQGGNITISCQNISKEEAMHMALKPFKEYVEIRVEDEGIGIPRNYLDKIFEPFFTTNKDGSGLGLSICHSIITKHGGHIRVQSSTEHSHQGTTFFIYLPASIDKEVFDYSPDESLKMGEGRILVMDDESILREITKDMLENMGYDVVVAEDGGKAIEIYSKAKKQGRPFDIVIMDLTVPGGIGGQDAIKELLKIDPDIKVIVSSGYANDPIMASYKDYGFKACIRKPYSISDLNAVLKRIL